MPPTVLPWQLDSTSLAGQASVLDMPATKIALLLHCSRVGHSLLRLPYQSLGLLRSDMLALIAA